VAVRPYFNLETSSRPEGKTVSFFKPLTTLAVGIAIGYLVLPKVLAKVGG
jgi:hypothetical protein